MVDERGRYRDNYTVELCGQVGAIDKTTEYMDQRIGAIDGLCLIRLLHGIPPPPVLVLLLPGTPTGLVLNDDVTHTKPP